MTLKSDQAEHLNYVPGLIFHAREKIKIVQKILGKNFAAIFSGEFLEHFVGQNLAFFGVAKTLCFWLKIYNKKNSEILAGALQIDQNWIS